MDLTLLICTRNNAHLLDRALESVARQVLPSDAGVEVLVVANRCTDATAEVARRWGESGRIPRLRYVSERRSGIAPARRRGLRESHGRLIGFVDDDCLLAPDWVTRALTFAEENPRAGAFGGRNDLLWAQPPTPLADLYGESLARQDLGAEARRMPIRGWRMPVGAGLVVRREAVVDSGWIERGVLRGRRSRTLSAGEDAEISLRILRAGWEVWYSPDLQLRHLIPADRMGLAYLRRLHRGFGRAEALLRALALSPQPRPRLDALAWSLREVMEVLQRYPEGYVRFVTERPTWLIRLSYARGCVEGAVRLSWRGPVP
ncbi:MAG TPA: glycosyltransferase [Solirubrobacterales bacterium]|nr:glycosyltransferase [Solirubrobacterales bacterium]